MVMNTGVRGSNNEQDQIFIIIPLLQNNLWPGVI